MKKALMAGALVLGLSAGLALAADTTKRFWVDKAAGVSIAFPVGAGLAGFEPASGRLLDSQVLVMNRPVLLLGDTAYPMTRGVATCMVRLRHENEGAHLQGLLAKDRAHAADGGRSAGQARCEKHIYGDGTPHAFYGVEMTEGALGLRETCVAAYRLSGNVLYPHVVSQMTTFTAGRHGYELQCMMAVKSESGANIHWNKEARAFLAIRDSIAVAPATP